jgi:hypothetical protein
MPSQHPSQIGLVAAGTSPEEFLRDVAGYAFALPLMDTDHRPFMLTLEWVQLQARKLHGSRDNRNVTGYRFQAARSLMPRASDRSTCTWS